MTLELQPITLRAANAFVRDHHRHSMPVRGWKFGVAAVEGDVLVGVGIASRPVARSFDDGLTLEVSRVCTDGTPNACSMLYAALTRAAFALGYRRVVTYTQARESGSSLRAAGWHVVAERPARSGWNAPSRPRVASAAERDVQTLWEATA